MLFRSVTLSTVFSISLVLWRGRSQGQPRESCTFPWGCQVCPSGLSSGSWDVNLHPFEQTPRIPQDPASPKESSCLPAGLGSALLCPARTHHWASRLDGFGSPVPRLGLDFHPAPFWQLPVPCLQGVGGSFSGQWMLAVLAELFHLIFLLLLPLSPSFFRDSEMPLGVPQAVG